MWAETAEGNPAPTVQLLFIEVVRVGAWACGAGGGLWCAWGGVGGVILPLPSFCSCCLAGVHSVLGRAMLQ